LLGREYDVPMPVANLAERIVIEAMNRGAGARPHRPAYLWRL
jgi:hypothetical protein